MGVLHPLPRCDVISVLTTETRGYGSVMVPWKRSIESSSGCRVHRPTVRECCRGANRMVSAAGLGGPS
jgi:hypothetical protein